MLAWIAFIAICLLLMSLGFYDKHRYKGKIKTCTRPFPHMCRVNGPCNGWPKDVADDVDELKSDARRDAD